MKVEKVKYKDTEFKLFYFSNPMYHEDWHEAERLELKYIKYAHHGPDYWDDELIFTKVKDVEIVEEYFKSTYW